MRGLTAAIMTVLLLIWISPCTAAAVGAYRIGPGDVLDISVWRDEELSKEITVPPDGVISFPLIGSINVTAMTVSNLQAVLTKKLAQFIPDVTATVMLKEINSLKAYVIGKVNAPGEYAIGLDTSVVQILAQAQGLTPFASKGKIIILRKRKGKTAKIPFDYGEIEKGDKLEQNIVIHAGDVVIVP